MGNGERQGRRALVDHAKAAVTKANECIQAVADVQEKHNILAGQVSTDVAEIRATLRELKERADAQRAWLKKLDGEADREQSRLTMTRIELGQSSLEHGNFALMSRWQRLRWILTGHWPKPLPGVFVTEPETAPEKATVIAAVETPAGSAPYLGTPAKAGGYIPHTSYGPSVLP